MRKDVTVDPPVVADILARAEVLWLAFTDEHGPCCVPVNFAAMEGGLCIHSGRRGRKAAALDSGALLAFSAAVDLEPKTGDAACKYGYRFRSVMGTGRPRRVEGEEIHTVLDAITLKYAGKPLPYEDRPLAATVAYVIDIAAITARIKE
ncbi:pyridoxamine 5'-phosphate oxidase family protein [Pseudodesulfovibrio sp. F-1]|uniref:Pyridoxamine 5'-phosphate oxidase family protein n=1 Tax=Pseudodesulfovibrio alkaliphilus TaxID=2661613 RepID=A0A7K1KJW9_9BACT|nr:pyridoxamine 5'-phosphate oxidase family protein [Pseudodesulfovibrio alkaliphilus]MUM76368.1 pyridoxamine 5'-phosphate oxidase family protein [Pseudodesulfovibrio alkaliphilus]